MTKWLLSFVKWKFWSWYGWVSLHSFRELQLHPFRFFRSFPSLTRVSTKNRSLHGTNPQSRGDSSLELEAVAAVHELSFAVKTISVSEILPRTPDLIFVNVTTVEGYRRFMLSFSPSLHLNIVRNMHNITFTEISQDINL